MISVAPPPIKLYQVNGGGGEGKKGRGLRFLFVGVVFELRATAE